MSKAKVEKFNIPEEVSRVTGKLKEAGFDNLAKIANAAEEELTNVKGLGKIKAKKMIKEAKSLLKNE